MRLWTLHPKYLDARGLGALWREGLLAQKVLRGGTKGYRHHPQLARFRAHPQPLGCIAAYLTLVREEARARGYRFDGRKIGRARTPVGLLETEGQLRHEWAHLKRKLRARAPALYREVRKVIDPEPHRLFRIIGGPARLF